MENRDRDKMNKNVSSTSTGDVNRSTSPNLDKSKDDSQSSFGKNSSRPEEVSNEPSRRSGSVDESGMKGSTGRSSEGSEDGSSGIDSSSSSSDSSRGSSGGSEH